MSKKPPPRPQTEPITYADEFPAIGEVAGKPVAPRDAAMMQKSEQTILVQTQNGGSSAAMQTAADSNDKLVVSGYVQSTPVNVAPPGLAQDEDTVRVTIGALEASALTAGDKPVNKSDAVAIQAAELRSTGSNDISPGGLAAQAQSAAMINAQMKRDEIKTKLADLVSDAVKELPGDKMVTVEDAERIMAAELNNNPNLTIYPGGVAASVVSAAGLNELGEK